MRDQWQKVTEYEMGDTPRMQLSKLNTNSSPFTNQTYFGPGPPRHWTFSMNIDSVYMNSPVFYSRTLFTLHYRGTVSSVLCISSLWVLIMTQSKFTVTTLQWMNNIHLSSFPFQTISQAQGYHCLSRIIWARVAVNLKKFPLCTRNVYVLFLFPHVSLGAPYYTNTLYVFFFFF